jgi:hypothetical protein
LFQHLRQDGLDAVIGGAHLSGHRHGTPARGGDVARDAPGGGLIGDVVQRYRGAVPGQQPCCCRADTPARADPADRVTLDDSIRLALTVVVERLTPTERAAFVLHDIFEFPFDAIAQIVGRSPAACRQLAGRALIRHIQAIADPRQLAYASWVLHASQRGRTRPSSQ